MLVKMKERFDSRYALENCKQKNKSAYGRWIVNLLINQVEAVSTGDTEKSCWAAESPGGSKAVSLG